MPETMQQRLGRIRHSVERFAASGLAEAVVPPGDWSLLLHCGFPESGGVIMVRASCGFMLVHTVGAPFER